ncbi:MAG TPA: TetR/AcrR family transcriptional regulator [Caulobacteraceae bacterium]|nr:TetR/AcrR family transcriptional regulator [Caulobacteraceae bacterium]
MSPNADPTPTPPPPTRKRRQTVSRLVAAAAAVIAEKGFQRASLDEIAARAGMTKGAIYSNFGSKDDLFWAVLGSRRLTISSEWRGDRPMRENLRANAIAFCANLKESRAHAGLLAEFVLYALGHDEARARWAEWYEAPFAQATPALEAYLEAEGMPPFRLFWTALQTMTLGVYIQHALTPELLGDDVIVAAFEALAGPPKP